MTTREVEKLKASAAAVSAHIEQVTEKMFADTQALFGWMR
jgi:hypothetical protein